LFVGHRIPLDLRWLRHKHVVFIVVTKYNPAKISGNFYKTLTTCGSGKYNGAFFVNVFIFDVENDKPLFFELILGPSNAGHITSESCLKRFRVRVIFGDQFFRTSSRTRHTRSRLKFQILYRRKSIIVYRVFVYYHRAILVLQIHYIYFTDSIPGTESAVLAELEFVATCELGLVAL